MEGKQTKGGDRNENQESFKNRGETGQVKERGHSPNFKPRNTCLASDFALKE